MWNPYSLEKCLCAVHKELRIKLLVGTVSDPFINTYVGRNCVRN